MESIPMWEPGMNYEFAGFIDVSERAVDLDRRHPAREWPHVVVQIRSEARGDGEFSFGVDVAPETILLCHGGRESVRKVPTAIKVVRNYDFTSNVGVDAVRDVCFGKAVPKFVSRIELGLDYDLAVLVDEAGLPIFNEREKSIRVARRTPNGLDRLAWLHK
jgi:hypothetical protein